MAKDPAKGPEEKLQIEKANTVQVPNPMRLARVLLGWVRSYADFRNLDSFLASEKGNGKAMESLPIIVAAQSIAVLSMILGFIVASFLYPGQVPMMLSQLVLGLVIIVLIGGALIFYISSGFMFLLAKLLGGNGELRAQFRVLAIATVCSNLISSPLAFLNIVFMGNKDFALPVIVVLALAGFYELFVFYKALRVVHGISFFRAMVTLTGTMMALYIVSGLMLLFVS